jgi:dihydrodipicolinate synthase/N-acetylneuraminate lyase
MAKYITPAITPLTPEDRIDESGAAALYEHLIAGGVDAVLVLGSIGEFFSIPAEQKRRLISLAVRRIDRLMDIYAVGSPFITFIKRAAALRGLPVSSAVSFPFPDVTEEQEKALTDILTREGLL